MLRNVRTQVRSFLKRSQVWLGMVALAGAGTAVAAVTIPNLFPFLDSTGAVATYSSTGSFDESGPFFQSLGTNGRTCASCHVIGNAMSLSAAQAERVYERTNGRDPLFSAVDGAACPTAAPGQPLNFSLLRQNGLIRIGIELPSSLQFTITAVHDPYGCALVRDPVTDVRTVSVYRRPLPSTNLGFLSSVMFDGRENIAPLNSPATFSANLITDLKHQSVDATTGHAQAPLPGPSDAQQTQMVNFELALNSAQALDFGAENLGRDGANGGPVFLTTVPFFPGINDSLGPPAQFTPNAFTIYSKWQYSGDPERRSIARGEQIFNTHALTITNVRGLNDALNQPAIPGTCTTCHDTPNVGNHSLPVPLEIGTSRTANYETDPTIQAAVSQLSMPDMPVFQIVCNQGPNAGQITYTSDPGKALLTGSCGDVGRGKGPVLRGLAARAPFFHNGAAATLSEVVDFYSVRFQMNLTPQEKRDLVNFLQTL
jgi:cytochrome c peroxidase